MILSQGHFSRVYQSLVYDKQLAIEADASGNFTEDPNLFFAILIMNRGANVADGEKAMNEEIQRLTTEPVSDVELKRRKTRFVRRIRSDANRYRKRHRRLDIPPPFTMIRLPQTRSTTCS